MNKVRKNLLKVLGVFLLLIPTTIYAASGTVGNNATSMSVGASKDIDIILMAANDVQAVGGRIESNDSSCVRVNEIKPEHNKSDAYGSMFSLAANGAVSANTVMVKVNVTGLKECSTTLKYTNVKVTSTTAVNSNATISAGTITVGNSSPGPSQSGDNTLSGLTISSGTLDPAFNPNVTSYTVTVPGDVTSVSVNATKNHNKASVVVNGGNDLQPGENTITVTVTAENGTPKTYTIKVIRDGEVQGKDDDKSNDNTLKSLDVSGYTLTPGFDPNTLTYSITVANTVTGLNVNALANNDKASVSISGNTNFQVGMNTIYIKVTAENGEIKTYTVNVKRTGDNNQTTQAAKSGNNYLTNILISNGELTPQFNKDTQSYSITVAKDVNELDIKTFTEDPKATVEILDNKDLKIGSNTVSIKVTSEDGQVRIYTINVNKIDKEANNDIDKLIIGGTTITPDFDKDTTYYDATVPGKTKQISINAIPVNPNAKVEYYVNGQLQSDGNIKLEEGYNLITIKVTDENGLSKLYYINAYRKAYTYDIFGIKIPKWLAWTLLLSLIGLIALIIFLVARHKEEEEEKEELEKTTEYKIPNIEIKPEFNFGSKNQDNDTVSDGAVLNQESEDSTSNTQDNDNNGNTTSSSKNEEVPYDPYDEVVTVDELIDAIDEQDPKKLRILYEQEMLNRKKEELKNKSRSGKHSKKDDEDEEE